MTFSPTIPGPNDLLSQSQSDIQTNFAQQNTIFSNNHITFNDATVANRGKHTHVNLINQVPPATAANEGALYVLNTNKELYYRNESNGTSIPLSFIGGFACVSGAGALLGNPFNLTAARTAIGKYTMTFTVNMTNANYVVLATANAPAGNMMLMSVVTKAVGSFTLECLAVLHGQLADPTSFSVLVFGETVI